MIYIGELEWPNDRLGLRKRHELIRFSFEQFRVEAVHDVAQDTGSYIAHFGPRVRCMHKVN
jgi:hypothetical protein